MDLFINNDFIMAGACYGLNIYGVFFNAAMAKKEKT